LALFTNILSILADLATIAASSIAIYLFFVKGKTISTALSLLMNYSYQLTLSELKEKLERLNDYNASDSEDCNKIVNILHEIIGQIKGNEKLYERFSDITHKIELLASDKRKLTEPRKRSLVSELRERLRNINVTHNALSMIGEENE
jgi:hypothetical protein